MTQAIAASSFAVSDLHYPTRIDREPPRGGRGKRGSVRPVRRRRIPLRIRDLEPAARLDIRDLHEPLAARRLEFLHHHGHGGDDGTDSQGEAPHPLLALGIANVMQSRLLDRIALARVAELSAVPGD
jgi:hypothetical protein